MRKNQINNEIRKLVPGLWNNDIQCLQKLYLLTVDDVYNYCRIVLGDEIRACAAVSDVYSTAVSNILRLKDPSLFVSWLRRIAFDECYNRVLQDSRTDLYSLLHPEEMESLPFFERQIFFLHDFAGLTDNDIAAAIHTSKRHVLKGLHSARAHMLKLRELQRA